MTRRDETASPTMTTFKMSRRHLQRRQKQNIWRCVVFFGAKIFFLQRFTFVSFRFVRAAWPSNNFYFDFISKICFFLNFRFSYRCEIFVKSRKNRLNQRRCSPFTIPRSSEASTDAASARPSPAGKTKTTSRTTHICSEQGLSLLKPHPLGVTLHCSFTPACLQSTEVIRVLPSNQSKMFC